ncbi:hypothetical protein ACI3E1_07225 [Ligilactobacillus sp. LYQ139]|uniref:hypothetical protein n=1 Tax=Ligilactobacillus sp. LYQ139 TaxID=3378800 RepID=UPI003854AAD5
MEKPELRMVTRELELTPREFNAMTDQELIRRTGLTAMTTTGVDVTDQISFDKSMVDQQRVGLPQSIPILFRDGRSSSDQKYVGALSVVLIGTQFQKRGGNGKLQHHRKWSWIVVFLIVIGLIVAGIHHQHLINQDNQAEQTSQTSRINNNAQHISDLAAQVKELRDAIKQYKQDNDNQAYQNALNNIQQQLNNIKSQQTNTELQNLINRLNNVIDQLRGESPTQAEQTLRNAHLAW